MADISKIARVFGGVARNVDLSLNTLVVDNIKMKLGGSFSATFSGSLTATRTITMPDADVNLGHIANLVSLSGVAGGSTNLGTFTGTTIPDSQTIKQALQALETAVESVVSDSDFADNVFRISDDGDSTKKIAFQASGIAASTVRTITMPDADVNLGSLTNSNISASAAIAESKLALDYSTSSLNTAIGTKVAKAGDTMSGNLAMGGNKVTGLGAASTAGDAVRYEQAILTSGANAFAAAQSMGGFKITSLADGTAAGDAVNKGQMDAALNGLKPKTAARVATTANITIATALNSGDTIDGITLADGDRVLVKDQSTASQNGIWVVDASPFRALDFDSASPIDEINGAMVPVEEGTANAGKIFVQSGAAVATVGTDPINFVYFNSISNLVGGDGITISGTNVSVDHDGEGLQIVSAQLALELDGTTLSKSASGLKVAALGITNAEISGSAAIAYSKLSLSASIVNADIASGAAIAYSKLNLAASIVDADVASGAAIAYSKLALSNSIVAGDLTSSSVTTAKIANAAVDSDKLAASVAGAGLTGGAGSALAVGANADGSITVNADDIQVAASPLLRKTMVAGESFAANTSFLVRMAMSGETASRVYKADKDSSVSDKFYIVGVALSTGAVSAGGNITVISLGTHVLGSSDSAFAGGDIGKAVFLTSSGAFSTTAPSAADEAVARIGVVENTDRMWVNPAVVGVN